MSISYHGVIGHGTGKVTLPSVDSWGSNMNIIRDPPKAVTTRKIDKVGDTASITQMIQESGDRFCEAINVYARGVNPMVAVSYGNQGTNGGQRVNGFGSSLVGQAYLPYRVARDGAFRPPIRSLRSLLPLSRQPRSWTSAFSKKGFADFTKKAYCPGTDQNTAGVKKTTLKSCIRPTAVYKMNTQVVEPYDTSYKITSRIKVEQNSGHITKGKITTNVAVPTKEVMEQSNYQNVNTNVGGHHKKDAKLSHKDTSKYMRDALHSNVRSNESENVQRTPIDELVNTNVETRDTMRISRDVHKTGYNKNEYIHDDVELRRVLPEHESRTNMGQNIYKKVVDPHVKQLSVNRPYTEMSSNHGGGGRQNFEQVGTRNYRLKPTISAGGFEGAPTMPTQSVQHQLPEYDQQRADMRSKIYEMQAGRVTKKNPYV